MKHDEAIHYASSHRFSINEALAVIEVRDGGFCRNARPNLGFF